MRTVLCSLPNPIVHRSVYTVPRSPPPPIPESGEYPRHDQVLFLIGELSAVPRLIQLLEPTRIRSVVPLHRTSIRNEQVRYEEIR